NRGSPMKRHVRTRLVLRVGTALLVLSLATLVSAQEPKKEPGKAPGSGVQKRTYDFKEAGKEMEYALFIPSKYDKEKKTPLMIALHGLGGNPQQTIRFQGLTEQAEKYGYIVVAPMGYNNSGWYGARGSGGGFGAPGVGAPGGGFGAPPGTVLSPRVQETLKLTDEQKKKIDELQKEVDATIQKTLTEAQNKQLKDLRDNAGRGPGGGIGGGPGAPKNPGEFSEEGVMKVLEDLGKDVNMDEK